MLLFLYLVGIVVSFIALAYFDMGGSAFLGWKAHDTDHATIGLICVPFWPLALALALTVGSCRTLAGLFTEPPKKIRGWICPAVRPTPGYREPVERCRTRKKSVSRPRCEKHRCAMVEEK